MAPLFLSLATTTAAYVSAGPTLGLFFGAFLLATLIVPPLLIAESTPRAIGMILGGVCAGAGIVWIASSSQPDVYLWDCVRCLMVFAAYLTALAGVTAVLRRLGFLPVVSAAITVVLGLAWLTWPVWLSGVLEGAHGQTIANVLVPAHPLFCVNGVMKHFGAWDHYPALAYPTLTVLNQDVSYNLPRSILPAVIVHAVLGAGLLVAAFGIVSNRRAPSRI